MQGKARAVSIEGVVYESITVAASELGVAFTTVLSRIRAKTYKWSRWRYAQSNDGIEIRGKVKRRIMIDGKIYESAQEASRILGLSDDAIRARASSKNPAFANYRYLEGSSIRRRQLRTKHVTVFIHGKPYESKVGAAKSLGLSTGAITHYLKHPKRYPDCYYWDMKSQKKITL